MISEENGSLQRHATQCLQCIYKLQILPQFIKWLGMNIHYKFRSWRNTGGETLLSSTLHASNYIANTNLTITVTSYGWVSPKKNKKLEDDCGIFVQIRNYKQSVTKPGPGGSFPTKQPFWPPLVCIYCPVDHSPVISTGESIYFRLRQGFCSVSSL